MGLLQVLQFTQTSQKSYQQVLWSNEKLALDVNTRMVTKNGHPSQVPLASYCTSCWDKPSQRRLGGLTLWLQIRSSALPSWHYPPLYAPGVHCIPTALWSELPNLLWCQERISHYFIVRYSRTWTLLGYSLSSWGCFPHTCHYYKNNHTHSHWNLYRQQKGSYWLAQALLIQHCYRMPSLPDVLWKCVSVAKQQHTGHWDCIINTKY